MAKVIAAINMTLDGFCDHTAVNADEELHDHFNAVLQKAGILLYGRTTFQLMEFWRDLAKSPSGQKDMDDFAKVMDETPKLVFSRTLKDTGWHSARLATRPPAAVAGRRPRSRRPWLQRAPSRAGRAAPSRNRSLIHATGPPLHAFRGALIALPVG